MAEWSGMAGKSTYGGAYRIRWFWERVLTVPPFYDRTLRAQNKMNKEDEKKILKLMEGKF